MCEAIVLAKYIVSKCMTDGCPISNLQLQKILYYIQRDFLRNDNKAFPDEIQAWQFGPVVPNVYYRFSAYGAMEITNQYDVTDEFNYTDVEIGSIDAIVEEKRECDPWELVEDTHRPGGAWDLTYEKGKSKVIPTDLIKKVG